MAPRRKREIVVTHCTTCGQSMNKMACCIDWHAVYVSNLVKDYMTDKGCIPSNDELEEMDASAGSDPCDDCCCGACGSRKVQPGVVCC